MEERVNKKALTDADLGEGRSEVPKGKFRAVAENNRRQEGGGKKL